jgi:hypothetical protein
MVIMGIGLPFTKSGLLPTGAPVSSARRLSTTAVNGWFAANQRTPAGIESAGTGMEAGTRGAEHGGGVLGGGQVLHTKVVTEAGEHVAQRLDATVVGHPQCQVIVVAGAFG